MTASTYATRRESFEIFEQVALASVALEMRVPLRPQIANPTNTATARATARKSIVT